MIPMIVLIAAIIMIVAVIAAVVIMSIVPMPLAVFFLVAGRVHIVVPIVSDEINRTAAGVVPGAVFSPVLGMAGRNPQVKRFDDPVPRGTNDNHGLGVNHRGSLHVADINLAIETRLSDADRHTNIRSARAGTVSVVETNRRQNKRYLIGRVLIIVTSRLRTGAPYQRDRALQLPPVLCGRTQEQRFCGSKEGFA